MHKFTKIKINQTTEQIFLKTFTFQLGNKVPFIGLVNANNAKGYSRIF